MFGDSKFRKIVVTIVENNVEDEVKANTVYVEVVTRKEVLLASRTLQNFMLQFQNATPELLDAIRKIRNKL